MQNRRDQGDNGDRRPAENRAVDREAGGHHHAGDQPRRALRAPSAEALGRAEGAGHHGRGHPGCAAVLVRLSLVLDPEGGDHLLADEPELEAADR